MQQPTIGRIVIAQNLSASSNNGSTEAPAIITRVWGESVPGAVTVNAKVILDSHSDLWLTSVLLFEEWPKAQAWLDSQRGAEGMAGYNPTFLVWPERV